MTGQKKSPWALFNVATVLPRLSPGGPASCSLVFLSFHHVCCSLNLFVPLPFSFPVQPAPRPTGHGYFNKTGKHACLPPPWEPFLLLHLWQWPYIVLGSWQTPRAQVRPLCP